MSITSQLNLAQLEQQIRALIPFHQGDICENDNLLELGLDSMNIMQLVNQWRSQGHNITFSCLIEQPTLSIWHELLT